MGKYYERVVRPLLFRLDSEHAHELGVKGMAMLGALSPLCRAVEWATRPSVRRQPVKAFGLTFPNAVGLAAGFDKHALAWPAAAAFGFGHVEIGTITAQPQPGNPKPRVFRYPAEEAVINRMGFNNEGAAAVAARLAKQPVRGARRIPLGINLGKSKVAAIEDAVDDYLASFARLADHADYVVLNVSSPNTPNLRQLQDESRLRELLAAVTSANRARVTWHGRPAHGRRDLSAEGLAKVEAPPKNTGETPVPSHTTTATPAATNRVVPLLLKIAPDLTWPQIDAVLGVIADYRLDGIIATNTTLARPGLFAAVNEAGGLSGAPLRRRSTEIVNYIARATSGRLPIIAVGGITNAESAAEKLDAGASLVQIYTGMIYRGPFFAAELARGLADCQRV